MSMYPPPQNQNWQQQSHPSPQGPYAPEKKKSGSKLFWLFGLGCLLPILLCGGGGFAFLVYIGYTSPDTFVVPGNQIKSRHRGEINALGLVDPGEKIIWFYSDGLFSASEGMYFLTDQNLVLYSDTWVQPRNVIPYNQITDLDIVYDDSFLTDSTVTVYTRDGEVFTFPVSSEQGGDKKFYQELEDRTRQAGGGYG